MLLMHAPVKLKTQGNSPVVSKVRTDLTEFGGGEGRRRRRGVSGDSLCTNPSQAVDVCI